MVPNYNWYLTTCRSPNQANSLESSGNKMKEFNVPIAILVAWIALNVWILPMLGFRTCMSGSCGTKQSPPRVEDFSDKRPSAPDQE